MERAIVCVVALSLTGCAAVFKGSTQDVKIVAVPESSDVRVDGQYKGATPTHAELKRNSSQNVKVSKDGFKEQYVTVKNSPDTPWWFWDIATCVVPVTLCIPVLVDAISGAWMSLEDEVVVKLEPLPIETKAAPPASTWTPTPSPPPAPAPAAPSPSPTPVGSAVPLGF